MSEHELPPGSGDELAQALRIARQLYNETVIDHWLHPRNHGALKPADGFARVTGPCGDSIAFWLRVEDGLIQASGFEIEGCATTLACASATTELVQGLSLADARRAATQIGILEALDGLPEANVHCALLAATAMVAAIEDTTHKLRDPWKKLYSRDR